MSGKRGFTLIEKISLMSLRGKITVIAISVLLVIGVLTGTYMAFTNDDAKKEVVAEVVQEEPENEIVIEAVDASEVNSTGEHPEDQEEVGEKEDKTVKYGDKEIKIPKTKVAAANSAEDSQKQKTGGQAISAEQAVSQFENDGQSVGIDVSAHQGSINWAAVKASGVEFAMIRCGFRGNSQGGIFQDAYFKSNIQGAVNNGIFVGIYFYSTAVNEEEALQEAAWVVNTIKSYRITYPVAYDFEDFGKYRCAGVSGEQATSNAIAFLNYVKSAGYSPMMYANKNDISNRFNRGRLGSYKFWLAHYTSNTNYTGKYQMWQYTSNGSVNGISGRVDMNIAYFRFSAVAEPKHTHDFEHGSIIKTSDSKAATCTQSGIKYIRCAGCSESKKEVIPALGHSFGAWTVSVKPTTETEGTEVRKCKTCGAEEKRSIKKLTVDNTNTNTNTSTNTATNTSTNTNTSTDVNTNTNTNVPDTNTNVDPTPSTDTNTTVDPTPTPDPDPTPTENTTTSTEGTNTTE